MYDRYHQRVRKNLLMAESATWDDTNHFSEPEAEKDGRDVEHLETGLNGQEQALQQNLPAEETGVARVSRVIWTPKFILLFTLALVLGLSADSLFTQGWTEGYFRAIWVLFGNFLVLLGLWIGAVIVARSQWVRMGAIFGCGWAVFNTVNLITMLFYIDLNTAVPAYLNAAFSCSLLGAFICFSTAYCELHRWDIWEFRAALMLGGVFLLVGLIFPSSTYGIPAVLATDIATVATVMSILVWWARPACWRTHPYLAFFFGVSPAIALLLSLPNVTNTKVNFFLTQVSLLCIMLGLLRWIQGERVQ